MVNLISSNINFIAGLYCLNISACLLVDGFLLQNNASSRIVPNSPLMIHLLEEKQPKLEVGIFSDFSSGKDYEMLRLWYTVLDLSHRHSYSAWADKQLWLKCTYLRLYKKREIFPPQRQKKIKGTVSSESLGERWLSSMYTTLRR